MPYPKELLIENILNSVTRALRHYKDWSGWDDNYWLFDAPEYLMTTYIAQGIAAHRDYSFFITLEHGTRHAMSEAGGMRRGQPRKDLRIGGRMDLVLWWANGLPRTVVEVKNHISRFGRIRDDVARMCSVLDQNNSIRRGLAVFYTSDSRDGLESRVRKISDAAEHQISARNYQLHIHTGKTRSVEGLCWMPVVLEIARR